MNQTKKTKTRLAAVLGAAVIIVGLYLATSAFITRGMTPLIEHQLHSLQTEDLISAYADTSKRFQSTTSQATFNQFVSKHSVLWNNQGIQFVSKKVVNGVGIVRAIITSRSGVETPAKYRLIKENGKWKITSLILYTGNAPDNHPAPTNNTATAVAQSNITLPNVYQNERYSFAISYPANWEYTQPNNKSVVFTTTQKSADISPTIAVRPLLHQTKDGRYRSVEELMKTVASKISTNSRSINIIEHGKVVLKQTRGEPLDGRYQIFSYTSEGKQYKQLEVVYYKTEDRALYAIEYRATAPEFDISLPIAKAMIESFVFE